MKKKHSLSKRTRILLWTGLILLLLALQWMAAGFPALTPQGAFHKTVEDNVLGEISGETQIRFTSWRALILGERKDGVVQGMVSRDHFSFFWYTTPRIAVSPYTGDSCFVPLLWGGPALAVKGEGTRAEVDMELNGKHFSLRPEGKQGSWFLFSFDSGEEDVDYVNIMELFGSADQIGGDFLGGTADTLRMSFRSFSEDGTLLTESTRTFHEAEAVP